MAGDDLESRVSALEEQVHQLTGRVEASAQDAAAARVLAGAADRDVSAFQSELRDFRQAASTSFNALRQDFVDLRQDFVDLRGHFENGFTEIRGRLDGTAAGQQRIADLLQGLIDQQEH